MEHLVPDLATCRKLKELGFEQDTEFYWVVTSPGNYGLSWCPDGKMPGMISRNDCYAAPTSQEIADQLPALIQTTKRTDSKYSADYIRGRTQTRVIEVGPTMAQALAQIWITLREEELF